MPFLEIRTILSGVIMFVVPFHSPLYLPLTCPYRSTYTPSSHTLSSAAPLAKVALHGDGHPLMGENFWPLGRLKVPLLRRSLRKENWCIWEGCHITARPASGGKSGDTRTI